MVIHGDGIPIATSTVDLPAIRRATDVLQKASHAMAEQLYKLSQANAASAAASASDAVKDGEVVDA